MISFLVVGCALLEGPRLSMRRSVINYPAAIASLRHEVHVSRRSIVDTLVSAGVGLVALEALPTAVYAESTLVTRQQAYSRYVPRIERGRDFWAGGLRKLISESNWKDISVALDKKGSIDRIFGPLELWASSFSSKTISDKTLAMSIAIDELREACRALQIACEGKESGGFLGFGAKTMDPNKRGLLAQAAYKKGVQAINKYIEIGNDGLGLQVIAAHPFFSS